VDTDGILDPENGWTVSFANSDTEKLPRGRRDTLYFTKFDAQSSVHVIKNNTDTLDVNGNIANTNEGYTVQYNTIGNETHKVKIEAGNKYTIAVTARDNVTRGFYYVTLRDDTVRPLPSKTESNSGYDTVKWMLKDIYLYDVANPSNRYDLYADTSGKPGFREDTLTYKVTVPWSSIAGDNRSIQVGYDFWDEKAFKDAGKKVTVYLPVTANERILQVVVSKATNGENPNGTKGGQDTTYTIRVLSGDNQLKNLHFSYDKADTKPIAVTRDSTGVYTSEAVGYNVSSVYACAALEDARASVKSVSGDWKLDTAKGEYFNLLTLTSITERGGEHTFDVPVRAEDTTLIKSYPAKVKMSWNPNLKKVTFKWTGQTGTQGIYEKSQLEADSVFCIQIPTSVDIEDVGVTVAEIGMRGI
jgi:hypothetical protein